MTLKVDATYENGVFVPAVPPALADHERVHLTIEPVGAPPAGSETVVRRRDHRIRLDARLAQDIAVAPEFSPEGN